MKTALLVFAAFIGGVAVSYVNYRFMLPAVKGDNEKRALSVSPLRSVLSAAYLFLLFFVGVKTGVSTAYLLIGGAVGLTLSLALFTKLLLSSSKKSDDKKSAADSPEKSTEGSESE